MPCCWAFRQWSNFCSPISIHTIAAQRRHLADIFYEPRKSWFFCGIDIGYKSVGSFAKKKRHSEQMFFRSAKYWTFDGPLGPFPIAASRYVVGPATAAMHIARILQPVDSGAVIEISARAREKKAICERSSKQANTCLHHEKSAALAFDAFSVPPPVGKYFLRVHFSAGCLRFSLDSAHRDSRREWRWQHLHLCESALDLALRCSTHTRTHTPVTSIYIPDIFVNLTCVFCSLFIVSPPLAAVVRLCFGKIQNNLFAIVNVHCCT